MNMRSLKELLIYHIQVSDVLCLKTDSYNLKNITVTDFLKVIIIVFKFPSREVIFS